MRRAPLLLAALTLAACAAPAAAVPVPDVMAEVGKTFAIDSPAEGQFDQGGLALALSALWPAQDFLRIGFALFADDMGSLRADLPDTAHAGSTLGLFDLAHVNVYGGAWRLDVVGPRLGRFDTFARGDWGIYRFRADKQGDYLGDETKLGWSLGGGIMLPIRQKSAVGVTFGYDRVFSDLTRDYMSAALAWHWRTTSSPRAAGAKR